MSSNRATSSSATNLTTATTMKPITLNCIVAATSSLGIGFGGSLPWPSLKNEMAYFARITKRTPRSCLPASKDAYFNAVIMGHKTWLSIPPRFRPLKDRINIVLSKEPGKVEGCDDNLAVAKESLDVAIQYLQSNDRFSGRAFVIGGAQIYRLALARRETKRILLTHVRTDFECDTFFPVKLPLNRAGAEMTDEHVHYWKQSTKEQLSAWVNETVPDGVQREKDVEYEFLMFERSDAAN